MSIEIHAQSTRHTPREQKRNRMAKAATQHTQHRSCPMIIGTLKRGDYVVRSGDICTITKIHFETEPPSLTVKMLHNGQEVGTEAAKLQKPTAWICTQCNIDHKDFTAESCSFCYQERTYKEKCKTTCGEHYELKYEPLPVARVVS